MTLLHSNDDFELRIPALLSDARTVLPYILMFVDAIKPNEALSRHFEIWGNTISDLKNINNNLVMFKK